MCPLPNENDRFEILRNLSNEMNLENGIDWQEIASLTNNFSGADLQSLLSTAQILSVQKIFGESLYSDIILKNIEPHTPAEDSKISKQYLCTLEKPKPCSIDKDNVVDSDTDQSQYSQNNDLNSDHLIKNENSDVDNFHLKSSFTGVVISRIELLKALELVVPSVSPEERIKYQYLYESFKRSREGNFGKLSPGKKATLS